jgi:exopolysaccharide biosynthesis WecB/TagA/CpsF family protein
LAKVQFATDQETSRPYPHQQVLGIPFFDGSARDAVEYITVKGGYTVVPAAPALVKLQHDPAFREAIVAADLAIADSGLMVVVWRILRGRKLSRISGLAYLKALLTMPGFAVQRDGVVWVVPSTGARAKTIRWAAAGGYPVTEADVYVAPHYGGLVRDEALVALIEERQPQHIVIGIGGGPQEKLGRFLRQSLSYHPAIHCIGAALGFFTGDQIAIPDWADRFFLGWLLRLLAQPRVFIPRLGRALVLPWLILRYGETLPPLKTRRKD